MTRTATIAATILALMATLAGTGWAAPAPDWAIPGRPDTVQLVQADFVPLESILRALRKRYTGHQLSVSGPNRSGGGFVYEIKWLTDDGRVLYVTADAETGAILSVEGG